MRRFTLAVLWTGVVVVAAAILSGPHTLGALLGRVVATVAAQTPCPLRGSCALEPGLLGRTDLLLFEDWELTNWQSHFTGLGFAGNTSAITAQAFRGLKSGEVRVPNGAHDGATLDFDFSSAGVADPEDIYFRYYLRFNDTWQRNGDGEIGKLPGFGGVYNMNGFGCNPVSGSDGWSARMMNWDRGSTNQVGYYVYHADMTATCGEHAPWPPQLERNRWYCIETHVRLNTISGSTGNRDGVLEGWIDDAQVYNRRNFRFRDVSSLKIEKVWGNIYVGGSWTADRAMAIHFDNVVVARNRIGCASTPLAPRAPTNLVIRR
jgi:hypothetical protein